MLCQPTRDELLPAVRADHDQVALQTFSFRSNRTLGFDRAWCCSVRRSHSHDGVVSLTDDLWGFLCTLLIQAVHSGTFSSLDRKPLVGHQCAEFARPNGGDRRVLQGMARRS